MVYSRDKFGSCEKGRLASLREDIACTIVDQSGRASAVALKDENAGRYALIKYILDNLGLSAHQDTIVGDLFLCGLSGGQKWYKI